MTKAQQVIKVFAYILAIVIIINIFTAIINIIGSVVDFSGTKDMVHYEEVYENINNIKIDSSASEIFIISGDQFKLDVNTNKKGISYKLENGTLEIKEKSNFLFKNSNSSIVITIPDGIVLGNLDIDNGAGKINISNVSSSYVDIDNGAGKITITNANLNNVKIDTGAGKLDINKSNLNNLDMSTGAGSVSITSSITGNSKIDTGVGSLELNLIGSIDDYKIKASKGLGSINIDNASYSSDTVIGNGSNYLEIDGGVGSIIVRFN